MPEAEAEDVSSATRIVATGSVKATLKRYVAVDVGTNKSGAPLGARRAPAATLGDYRGMAEGVSAN